MGKKIWVSFIIIIILLIPLFGYEFWYVPNYSGDDYYTFVGNSYKEIIEKDDSGNDYHEYYYNQKSYDKNGNEKLLKFNSTLGRPIKANNYLKVTYNDKHQQVISWQKVEKTNVPRKSLEQILK
ncbi:YxeA family protein [Companilactobacillus crustorum]|uniref:YxeA family protein n=1 Tax=Companilactobacillus crustorum TaxID=392416 RepID=UPI00237E0902|nr:YxeA family protein [Companilactobacillus crustorum]WDT66710.1 YxeA family protein [Companilactobacillus crustorum]